MRELRSEDFTVERYPRKIHRAMQMLLESYRYSEETDEDLWNFAIEIAELRAAGLNKTDLRWLTFMGYVETAVEVTPAAGIRRQFQRRQTARLTATTCLVPTTAGLRFAHELAKNRAESTKPTVVRPHWDSDRRELRVFGKLVKKFKLPSHNQERIVLAFQEEDWRFRIDDPLPPKEEQDAKRRLHATIKSLNRNQKNKLVRFTGDGTGQGVCWEFC